MRLFVGEPYILKGNWSAYGKVCNSWSWNRQIGGNFAPSAAFVSRNCRVFCVLSTATWDSENQDVFSWFWRISFKEAKRRSKERYRFMLSGFLFILMVLYKLLFSCHKTWKLQKPFECRIIKLRKKLNTVWQSHYFSRCYKISWPQHILVDLK